jgi:CDP-glycerol glycerophosphotransferase (TagB/SpsB family)
MALHGKGTVFTVKEFLPNLDTIVIPSLKCQYVWEFSENKLSQSKYVVLITLPISIRYTIFVIDRLLNVCNEISIKSDTIKYLIKPHPAQSLSKIKSNLPELPDYISLTEEKSFAKLLYSTNILITEASSTCLEAIACGIPVIMMENEEGLTYDPIPSRISEHLYRKVRSQDDLMQALKDFIYSTPEYLKQQQLDSAIVREDYFEPYSDDGIDRFLDIVKK